MNTNRVEKVVVIGAGPVGIAAAAQLLSRGITPVVLEQGSRAGAAMLEWGHVRVFSPWKYVIDKGVRSLLEAQGWNAPDAEGLPTGRDIVEQYLAPAANTPELAEAITYGAEVLAVSKQGHAKSSSSGRDEAGFTVHYRLNDGQTRVLLADAVIDASGTWYQPNPIGLDGLPVPGELENQERIVYGIPDAMGDDREAYEGQRVLVLGGGHSAINIVLDLLKLQAVNETTRIAWGLRSNKLDKLIGGGINDELPARGELGLAAKRAVDAGLLDLMAPFQVSSIDKTESGLVIKAMVDGESQVFEVDRIIVAAGFRPNLEMHRELRLDVDDIVEAPAELAPLIDPNLHSCGTVPPHGASELSHPDKNFFIVGMKAYGRAPTFLMLTGYEQVRSIAAALAGDMEAANRVELVLPKTGVCSSDRSESANSCGSSSTPAAASCCGTSPVVNSCCG